MIYETNMQQRSPHNSTYLRTELKIKHRPFPSWWTSVTAEWKQRLSEQHRCDVISCMNEYEIFYYQISTMQCCVTSH